MDLERFGIDPSSPDATERAAIAAYLHERGVPLQDVAATNDLQELALLAWAWMYGVHGERLTIEDAAGRAGLDAEELEKLLRALGFPEITFATFGLTQRDVVLMRLFADAASLLGNEDVLQLARVLGSSLGRIAEAAAGSIRVRFETPLRKEVSYAEFVRLTEPVVTDFLPRLAHGMDRILRYHLLRVSEQTWEVTPEGSAVQTELAIGFADMVGFTSRSSALSIAELTDLLDRFEAGVSDTVAALGGRAVKFIGDEVLFAFADVYAACVYSLQLVELAADEAIPDIRVGLAFGDVISRFGDYYGPVVNVASRLVEIAPSGSVLVSPEVVEQVGEFFAFEPQEPRTVKGVEAPLAHYRLS